MSDSNAYLQVRLVPPPKMRPSRLIKAMHKSELGWKRSEYVWKVPGLEFDPGVYVAEPDGEDGAYPEEFGVDPEEDEVVVTAIIVYGASSVPWAHAVKTEGTFRAWVMQVCQHTGACLRGEIELNANNW